jgi:hypothetical protein
MKKPRKIYAFIDSQNVNLSIREQGWVLDFGKFKTYLRSLPARHIKAGIVESVKQALYQDIDFFDFLEQHAGSYSWDTIERIDHYFKGRVRCG